VLGSVRAVFARLFRRPRLDAEMDAEMRSHVELRADDLERGGLSRAEAERRARVEFGGALRFREECLDAMGGSFVDTLRQDLRTGLRGLARTPVFTSVAVLTLALCISAIAVVFAALDGLVLKPLAVPRAESLWSIHRVGTHAASQSYPDYLDLRARNHSFEDLAGFNILLAGLDLGDDPGRTWLLATTSNYFEVLGIRPEVGRFFHDADDHGAGSMPVAVISHAFWERRFRSDPGVIGRVVRLNRQPFTIVGVAPRGFFGTMPMFSPDLWVPMVNQPQLEGRSILESRSNRWIFMTFGHLKAGVSRAQAASDLDAVSAGLAHEYPREHASAKHQLGRPGLYGDFLGGPVRAFLGALLLLAGLILVAACLNLGNLFAARASDRAREIALRLALGAGRGRVLRQLLTEAMLVTLSGGLLGLAASLLLLRGIASWNPFPQFPLQLPIHPDAGVLVVALVLAVGTGLAFGAVPVRQVMRTDPHGVIKAGTPSGRSRRSRVRDLLLVAQIAICALLVTSSIVAVRGLSRTLHDDFGFAPRGVMLAGTVLDMAGYRGASALPVQRELIEAVAALPGVKAVGSVDWVALTTGDGPGVYVFREDATDLVPARAAAAPMLFKVSPGYLRAAGTSLLAGRDVSWRDDSTTARVAVVNRDLARRLFGAGEDPLGRSFRLREGQLVQVVGVVEDGRYENLSEPQRPAMFVPLAQSPAGEMTLVVRSAEDPEALSATIRQTVSRVVPGLPCFLQTWDSAMSLVLFPARVASVALGVLGVMAAMLSVTGIFGLAAYSVSRRLREFGIRIALGADRGDVLRAALGPSVALLAWGSLAGIGLGLLASRVLALIVYEATPRDPVVLVGVVLVMALLGLFATWVPAQRALSVDPLALLRED